MPELEDQLADLGRSPRVAVAPVHEVLDRGDRLRRTRQRLLAGSAALLVVAAGGGAYALATDAGGPQTLQPAAPASTEPVAPSPTTTTRPTPSVAATQPAPVVTTPSPTGLQPDDQFVLAGIGPVVAGMTYDEVEAAAGLELRVSDDFDNGGTCVYLSFPGLPAAEQVSGIGVDGTVRRVEVGELSGRVTQSGVGVGDTVERAREVYGTSLIEEPHPYTGGPESPGNLYLRVQPAGSPHQLLLETRDGLVIGIRSGFVEEVGYIEGCA